MDQSLEEFLAPNSTLTPPVALSARRTPEQCRLRIGPCASRARGLGPGPVRSRNAAGPADLAMERAHEWLGARRKLGSHLQPGALRRRCSSFRPAGLISLCRRRVVNCGHRSDGRRRCRVWRPSRWTEGVVVPSKPKHRFSDAATFVGRGRSMTVATVRYLIFLIKEIPDASFAPPPTAIQGFTAVEFAGRPAPGPGDEGLTGRRSHYGPKTYGQVLSDTGSDTARVSPLHSERRSTARPPFIPPPRPVPQPSHWVRPHYSPPRPLPHPYRT
jgi:hypothetical protein